MALTRHAEIWFPSYARGRVLRRLQRTPRPERVWLTIADHFEPLWHKASEETAERRVRAWRNAWPEISRRNVDSTGRCAQYSFFYAEEEYRPHLLDPLAEMVHAGFGDVEVHLHHDHDHETGFIGKIQRFTGRLHEVHGLLRKVDGRLMFGFIHGNWALDNSRPDGLCCGLNNEITLLRDLGCYADFTMPSGDEPTQVRQVNCIYWAIDDPARPRSHERGPVVRAGLWEPGDLLMIPGPIGVRWGEGRFLAKLEAAELSARDVATAPRVRGWLELAPRIGADIFLKIHSHGAQDSTLAALLSGELDNAFRLLSAECQRRQIELRYVTAWEMRLAVERAARGGREATQPDLDEERDAQANSLQP
ncbi:MAG: hypothetical protein ABSC08_10250 [Bryobacteraceae bacterium]|jgi:hypothetical protein